MMRIVSIGYWVFIAIVIGGHFFFAYQQWFEWPELFNSLAIVASEDHKAIAGDNTGFLGRSIASYNASVGLGLLLSILLGKPARHWVQGMILFFIVLTAAVGASGTAGYAILVARLLPAAIALVLLLVHIFQSQKSAARKPA